MERSSRVLSGTLLRCSILPPTCSRNVRSVVSTTRASAIASIAATIPSQCSGPAASTVMSRTVYAPPALPRSTEPTVPPACPMASATRPSVPGLSSASTLMVSENWAEGVAAMPTTLHGLLCASEVGRDRQAGGAERVQHRGERRRDGRVGRGPVARLAEQAARQQRAVLEQFAERLEHVGPLGVAPRHRRPQRGLAHQLLDERSARALGALD